MMLKVVFSAEVLISEETAMCRSRPLTWRACACQLGREPAGDDWVVPGAVHVVGGDLPCDEGDHGNAQELYQIQESVLG
jgi:hypothetical protein